MSTDTESSKCYLREQGQARYLMIMMLAKLIYFDPGPPRQRSGVGDLKTGANPYS